MAGYGIFAGCILLLGLICLLERRSMGTAGVKDMIYAGGLTGSMTLTGSVFAAWMWTTSVFGAAETYALYGIWGPVSYVTGACIAFAGLIAFLVYLRKRYPGEVSWLGYIQRRYGGRTKRLYYLFAVVAPAYVLIEQGVGIAYVLETFYGSSFKIISFFSVLLAMALVYFGGMRTVLAEERLVSLLIMAAFAAGAVYVWRFGADVTGGLVQTEHLPARPASEASAGALAAGALQYFLMAIVIAFGQIVFDPAYYLKANLAKTTGALVGSFSIGGIVLWGGITLASSVYLGRAAAASGSDVTGLFEGPAKAVFSAVIIFIGISTIAHYMIGWLGIASLDLYGEVVAPKETDPAEADSADQRPLVFARILLVAIGIFCACMTIALENISLLTIDVFCAIFFAAPCVPLLLGCFSRRSFGRLAAAAVILGILGGLVVWMALPASAWQAEFAGMGASLLIPLLVMLAGYVKRMPYDG